MGVVAGLTEKGTAANTAKRPPPMIGRDISGQVFPAGGQVELRSRYSHPSHISGPMDAPAHTTMAMDTKKGGEGYLKGNGPTKTGPAGPTGIFLLYAHLDLLGLSINLSSRETLPHPLGLGKAWEGVVL